MGALAAGFDRHSGFMYLSIREISAGTPLALRATSPCACGDFDGLLYVSPYPLGRLQHRQLSYDVFTNTTGAQRRHDF